MADDKTDIAKVAEGLTEAQRRALLEGSETRMLARNWPNRNKMVALGLALPLYGKFVLQPTDTGLAVRDHLRSRQGEG